MYQNKGSVKSRCKLKKAPHVCPSCVEKKAKYLEHEDICNSILKEAIKTVGVDEVCANLVGSMAMKKFDPSIILSRVKKVVDNDYVVATPDRHVFKLILKEVVYIMKRMGLMFELMDDDLNYSRVIGPKNMEIYNFKIDGFSSILSLIWYPEMCTCEEILNRFDINVCKIGYNVMTRELIAEQSVLNAILRREATVDRQFHFFGTFPTAAENRQLAATLGRMEKYSERGFTFSRPPKISFGMEEWHLEKVQDAAQGVAKRMKN